MRDRRALASESSAVAGPPSRADPSRRAATKRQTDLSAMKIAPMGWELLSGRHPLLLSCQGPTARPLPHPPYNLSVLRGINHHCTTSPRLFTCWIDQWILPRTRTPVSSGPPSRQRLCPRPKCRPPHSPRPIPIAPLRSRGPASPALFRPAFVTGQHWHPSQWQSLGLRVGPILCQRAATRERGSCRNARDTAWTDVWCIGCVY